jgi:hypothetical protein
MITKHRCLLCLLLLLLLLAEDAAVAEEPSNCKNNVVLVIGAANQWVNWTHVESFSNKQWSIQEGNLVGFGEIMRNHPGRFQAALDRYEPQLVRAIKLLRPSVLLVASKGLNVLTHLAWEDIWNGPSVLLSPIPNGCNHIGGSSSAPSWEAQWDDTMKVLVSKQVGPISIGVGTSLDEKELITDMIEETGRCGAMQITTTEARGQDWGTFETCQSWKIRSFPGDHGWKGHQNNAGNVAMMIDEVVAQSTKQRTDKL